MSERLVKDVFRDEDWPEVQSFDCGDEAFAREVSDWLNGPSAGGQGNLPGPGPVRAISECPRHRALQAAGFTEELDPFVDKQTGTEYCRMAMVLDPDALLNLSTAGGHGPVAFARRRGIIASPRCRASAHPAAR
jgi:hypothetical protein